MEERAICAEKQSTVSIYGGMDDSLGGRSAAWITYVLA